jgi:ubiquinone/menaquinone biosynthesis C-methylase UbiE
MPGRCSPSTGNVGKRGYHPVISPNVTRKLVNSLFFFLASLLTVLMVFLAFAFILAKEKTLKAKPNQELKGVFLADKKKALDFYLIFSHVYDRLNPHFYSDSMRSNIVNLIPMGRCLRVLDVGCGTGYTTTGVLNRNDVCEVFGLDMNPVQLAGAVQNLHSEKSRVILSRGDAENLPFEDETFDAVVSVGAIEYFPNPARAMREMARVAKAGAVVAVGGPDAKWFSKFLIAKVLYSPSNQELKNLFLDAGLGNLKSVLIGVNTYFRTNRYVVAVAGIKA